MDPSSAHATFLQHCREGRWRRVVYFLAGKCKAWQPTAAAAEEGLLEAAREGRVEVFKKMIHFTINGHVLCDGQSLVEARAVTQAYHRRDVEAFLYRSYGHPVHAYPDDIFVTLCRGGYATEVLVAVRKGIPCAAGENAWTGGGSVSGTSIHAGLCAAAAAGRLNVVRVFLDMFNPRLTYLSERERREAPYPTNLLNVGILADAMAAASAHGRTECVRVMAHMLGMFTAGAVGLTSATRFFTAAVEGDHPDTVHALLDMWGEHFPMLRQEHWDAACVANNVDLVSVMLEHLRRWTVDSERPTALDLRKCLERGCALAARASHDALDDSDGLDVLELLSTCAEGKEYDVLNAALKDAVERRAVPSVRRLMAVVPDVPSIAPLLRAMLAGIEEAQSRIFIGEVDASRLEDVWMILSEYEQGAGTVPGSDASEALPEADTNAAATAAAHEDADTGADAAAAAASGSG